jgi:CubicO group peptidase (beta-lactamase class C family)
VLDKAIAEERIVGAVVLVSREGKLVYHRAVGLADREASTPMREDTIFRYASVSKPIVAKAALALVEQGELGLDDPVTRYLPDFQPALPDGTTPTLTVRQLLTHTSGLSYPFLEPEDGPYHQANVSGGLDQPGLSFPENAARLASVPLVAPPGERFHYSMSTDVLGEVAARAAGITLPELVEQQVTGPLGMSDTTFVVTDPERLAVAYANDPGGPVRMSDGHAIPYALSSVVYAPTRALDPSAYPSGGAGMAGTAGDLLAFLEDARRGAPEPLQVQTGSADTSFLGEGVAFGWLGAVLVDPERAGSPARPGTVRWGGAYGHSWLVDPEGYPELASLQRLYRGIHLYRDWDTGRRSTFRVPQPADLPDDFLLSSARNLAIILNAFQRHQQTWDGLHEAMRRLYPGFLELKTIVQGGTIQLFLREKGLEELVPATRLSDGTLRYLALLAVLLHPTPPPLVCIEEPELGLHPDLIDDLARLLVDASGRCQLVVTTHSDHLVNALSDTPQAVLVTERGEQGTVLWRLEPDKLAVWLQKYRLGELWMKGEIGGTRW